MEIDLCDIWKVDVTNMITKIIVDTKYFASIEAAQEFVNIINKASDNIKATEPFKIY